MDSGAYWHPAEGRSTLTIRFADRAFHSELVVPTKSLWQRGQRH